MNILLAGEAQHAMVFIDDIVIFSRSVEDHQEHVKRVIRILTENNLKVNIGKSNFAYRTLYLLGHKISTSGTDIDRRKLLGIETWPTPNATNVEHYLGLFNYFRAFVPRYSSVVSPIDKIRKNFDWGATQEEAWNLIKRILVNAPTLCFPDFQKPFYSASDASGTGVAAILFQKQDDSKTEVMDRSNTKIIAFASRALQKAERRYSATKKEALGIVFCLVKFRYYLLGREWEHYTDHRALTWLFSINDDNRTTNTWIDTVMEFSGMRVIYLPGILNVIPDHLSRLYSGVKYLTREGGDPSDETQDTGRQTVESGDFLENNRLEVKCKELSQKVLSQPQFITLQRTDFFGQLQSKYQFDFTFVAKSQQ